MRYAIELVLNEPATRSLREVKERLTTVVPGMRPIDPASDPHVTLGACAALDVEACGAMLSGMVLAPPLPCRFDSLGIFATDSTVLFAAPVVTRALLELHTAFHDRFQSVATGQSAYYQPGFWVPHCTLAERVPPVLVPDAVATAHKLRLPIVGEFSGIRIVDIPAARILREVAFTPAR